MRAASRTDLSKPPTNVSCPVSDGLQHALNLRCPDEFGYAQIDPHGPELLFRIIVEREERTCIALARIVAESMDFAERLELVCADAGVALVP